MILSEDSIIKSHTFIKRFISFLFWRLVLFFLTEICIEETTKRLYSKREWDKQSQLKLKLSEFSSAPVRFGQLFFYTPKEFEGFHTLPLGHVLIPLMI